MCSVSEPLAEKLTEFFVHRESAKVIGRKYLLHVPKEANVDLLVNLLCSFQQARYAELAQADRGKLRELLLYQQRQDFEHGHIVKVQGWILSETEVRLCALAALDGYHATH